MRALVLWAVVAALAVAACVGEENAAEQETNEKTAQRVVLRHGARFAYTR